MCSASYLYNQLNQTVIMPLWMLHKNFNAKIMISVIPFIDDNVK